MISDINAVYQVGFQPQSYTSKQAPEKETYEPASSFADEDEAIISSQAKLLNELDKFNSGADNGVDLAVANVMAKVTTEAEVNVINTKKKMMDEVLKIGE